MEYKRCIKSVLYVDMVQLLRLFCLLSLTEHKSPTQCKIYLSRLFQMTSGPITPQEFCF